MSYKKILIPLDGSEHSALALDKAIELGKLAGSTLTLLHVKDMTVYMQTAVGTNLDGIESALESEGRRILEDAAAKVRAEGIPCTETMAEGSPGRTICEMSKDQDLIVMGTAGRTGLKKLLIGSVAQTVVANAECPVMAVKKKETKK